MLKLITARAFKSALDAKLSSLTGQTFDLAKVSVRLKGYRTTKKIGSGDMTEVYLAEHKTDGLPIVLKILDSRGKEASEHLVRLIQEYALLSKIVHRHVIRIYDQGFSDEHAYIAMEYFERGNLRSLFGLALTRRCAMRAISGNCAGAGSNLSKRHRPARYQARKYHAACRGSVALADVGIAKSVLQADGFGFTQTRHGNVVGTPYYLSPEQASGQKLTTQFDLYSLGGMMFEMLAARRPFMTESLELFQATHICKKYSTS